MPLLGKEQVPWFEIPMKDARHALVQEVEGPREFQRPHVDGLRRRAPRLSTPLLVLGVVDILERAPRQVLGDDDLWLSVDARAKEENERGVPGVEC